MWHLTSENDKRIIYVLPEKNVTLGRSLDGQNCNFAISEDPSISRKHATLLVSEGALFLKDLGSKYGTYVNNSNKIDDTTMIKLSSNDVIKLGKMDCVWKVHQVDLITCTSTLKGENLQTLKSIICKIGGVLKNEWDDTCTYLTMPAITLTIKVVLALVQNAHIVTVEYWNKCLEAINNNFVLPNSNNFVPQILESTLNKENVSFHPNSTRSTLFAGKKFIFFSRKQLDMYKIVLSQSSATALLLSESKITKSSLCNEGVIVIQYNVSASSQETQSQRDQINDIIEYLKNKGKRVVADAEIGLAILYCSTNKYCNPNFNFSSEVIKQVPQQNNSKNVLAPESQEFSTDLCKNNDNFIIDESLTQTSNNSLEKIISSKRKLSEDGANTNLTKKPRETVSKLSLKRQNESNDLQNPSKKVAIATGEVEDEMFKLKKSPLNNDENILKKKLNLSKPVKRKYSVDDDDDDNSLHLINKSCKKTAKDEPTTSNSNSKIDENQTKILKNLNVDEKFDLNTLRGSKLEELKRISVNIPCLKNIKKEDITELDDKFSNIELGSTTLIVRTDLIVKKEAIHIQSMESGLKNFKKFKKNWPAKMQVILAPIKT